MLSAASCNNGSVLIPSRQEAISKYCNHGIDIKWIRRNVQDEFR